MATGRTEGRLHPALTSTGPGTSPGATPAATAVDVAGIAGETAILTLEGEMPLRHLLPVDRLLTRGSGIARLTGLMRVRADAALVRFCARSLGQGRPESDVLLGPGTRVLIRDWRAGALWGMPSAMVPAARLADGCYIRREPLGPVDLLLPQIDRPGVIYAGGLEIGLP